MRYRLVLHQLGLLLLLQSAAMLPSGFWAMYDHFAHIGLHQADESAMALLASAAIGAMVSGGLIVVGRTSKKIPGRREALLLVALTWIVGAALSAMPYRIWAGIHDFSDQADPAFQSYVKCYFEAMSGLTTTGATVLTDIESLPRTLLLWRAFTQWIGGLGIVVLFVAVLPLLGVGGKRLFRSEAPGPKKEGVRPRIRAAAQVLWILYTGMTVVQILALRIAGLGWCDAFSHAFTTLSTGGFSTSNSSIAGLHSLPIELIIIVFMLLAAVNFGLYDKLIHGKWREVVKDPELGAYAGIMLVATVFILAATYGDPMATVENPELDTTPGFWTHVRYSLFTVVSLQTTTGFCTVDFDQWDYAARAVLVGLMFVGGCAGSTAGGIKVIRFVVLAKVLLAELEAVFRPHVIRPVRVGHSVIEPPLRSATLVYFLLVGAIVIAGTSFLIWMEGDAIRAAGGDDALTCFSTVAATLNNIGPGLDLVGASKNYAFFQQPTLVVLSLLMAMGRLELFAFLVLLVPGFWRDE